MKADDFFRYLLLWSTFGAVIFSFLVVILFRTGVAYTSRNPDGTLKRKVPISGMATSFSLLLGIVGLQIASNYWGLKRQGVELNWGLLFLVNYALYFVLLLYDTVVIDYLVIVKWRPDFLMLPETMNWQSMKTHILATIPVGPVVGLLLTAVSVAISRVVFLH